MSRCKHKVTQRHQQGNCSSRHSRSESRRPRARGSNQRLNMTHSSATVGRRASPWLRSLSHEWRGVHRYERQLQSINTSTFIMTEPGDSQVTGHASCSVHAQRTRHNIVDSEENLTALGNVTLKMILDAFGTVQAKLYRGPSRNDTFVMSHLPILLLWPGDLQGLCATLRQLEAGAGVVAACPSAGCLR